MYGTHYCVPSLSEFSFNPMREEVRAKEVYCSHCSLLPAVKLVLFDVDSNRLHLAQNHHVFSNKWETYMTKKRPGFPGKAAVLRQLLKTHFPVSCHGNLDMAYYFLYLLLRRHERRKSAADQWRLSGEFIQC